MKKLLFLLGLALLLVSCTHKGKNKYITRCHYTEAGGFLYCDPLVPPNRRME